MTIPKELHDKWEQAQRTGEPVPVGDFVVCDGCDKDFSNSQEAGGIIFTSSAYCPACAPRIEDSAKKYGETRFIRGRAEPGETFADFVRRYRGPNACIQIRQL